MIPENTLREPEQPELSIQQLLEDILGKFLQARSASDYVGKNLPIWLSFTRLNSALASLPCLRNRPTLRIEWSVGKGRWARVPWVALIDSREADAPTGGIYCVFLFREDMTGVYATLNQGITKPKQEFGSSEARAKLKDRARKIRAVVPDIEEHGFLLDDHIDLRSTGLGAGYKDSTIAYKLYETGMVPPESELERDLQALLTAYSRALQANVSLGSTWIFQGNPKLFAIDEAVARLSDMTWTVSAHRDQIAPGDEVFVWRSGAEGAIVARATVLTAPDEMEESNDQLEFALDKERFQGVQIRVRLRIDTVITPPLLIDVLRADPRLADLSIFKFSQGTNFSVSPEQAAVIRELLETDRGDQDEIPDATAEPRGRDIDSRVWAYAPGPKAQFWEEFYRDEIIAIGWDEMGDLRQYPDHESVANKLVEVYKLTGFPINDARACFNFVHLMKPGDRVIAKRGRDEVIGYGIVTGDYEYRPERTRYCNVRRVRWERRGNWKCKPLFAVKTLTDFTRYPEEVQYLMNLIGVSEAAATVPPPAEKLPPYTIEDALKGVAFDKAHFQEILDTWGAKKNLILQGPPGVGKTFLARKLAYALLGHEIPSRVEMVQFHQSYSYEDFVQGYRPSESGFSRRDGIFVRFCKRASLDQDSSYVFIIDEINRSNLSKVFGELLMLIESDKRGSKNSLALTYSTSEEEQFYVPSNVYALGMMNTADRSLALVDYALRRRFAFVELNPLFGSAVFTEFLTSIGTTPELALSISKRLQGLNRAITDDPNLGSGFNIGHSFFCGNGFALTEKAYRDVVRYQIVPLLKEYWFDNQDLVDQWGKTLQAQFD